MSWLQKTVFSAALQADKQYEKSELQKKLKFFKKVSKKV